MPVSQNLAGFFMFANLQTEHMFNSSWYQIFLTQCFFGFIKKLIINFDKI